MAEESWASVIDSDSEEEEVVIQVDVGQTVLINGKETSPKGNFNELNITNILLVNALRDKGYLHPSSIQGAAIPLMNDENGGNIVAQGPSGSGKTAAISIGILDNVQQQGGLQAVCICHTRELAIQNFRYIRKIAEFTKIEVAIAIPEYSSKNSLGSDAKAEEDIIDFLVGKKKNFDVVVGTPGSLIKSKCCNSKSIKILVLDEADEFLLQGGDLKKQVYKIKSTCKRARIFLFSATFEEDVKQFVNKFMGGPAKYTISLPGEECHVENLLQYYIIANSDGEKQKIVTEIYTNLSDAQSLLFCNTRSTCDKLAGLLSNLGFTDTIGKLHGKLSDVERDNTLNKFRRGDLYHLIVTNVLARGINIPEISFVINFDLPRKYSTIPSEKKIDLSTYTHRVGRCTRWSNKGVVINLVQDSEKKDLEVIKGKFAIDELKFDDIEELDARLTKFRNTIPDEENEEKKE